MEARSGVSTSEIQARELISLIIIRLDRILKTQSKYT